MGIRNNDLVRFNAQMLLNKREVIESVEDFIDHHRQTDNEEGYSGSKREALLEICEKFLEKIQGRVIPAVVQPWYCYEYAVTNDGMTLDLVKYSEVSFDEDGILSSSTSSPEYTLVEVKCEYLSVEQYAALHSVTVTTVRQWIRRGKLRTAKKVGGEWRIPALADTPKRGFEAVTYYWEKLPEDIMAAFPFLTGTECVFIMQDAYNRKIFPAITGWPGSGNRQRTDLTIQQREQLELMLIAAAEVRVEEPNIIYVPGKRTSTLPLLIDKSDDLESLYDTIVVVPTSGESAWFWADSAPGKDFNNGEPEEYILAVAWEFWGISGDNDVFDETLEGNFSNCVKLGHMTGQLILGAEMIADGCDPLVMCDDLDADMGYTMYHLTKESGPLNEQNGDPYENVLCITELKIEDAVRNQNVGSRILRELPWLCRKLMHIRPGILCGMIGTDRGEREAAALKSFYMKNGFQEIHDSLLMYAYTG